MNSNTHYNSEEYKQYAGKGCKEEGKTLLKIKYLQKTGYFCNFCTSELLQLGLAVREEREQ